MSASGWSEATMKARKGPGRLRRKPLHLIFTAVWRLCLCFRQSIYPESLLNSKY